MDPKRKAILQMLICATLWSTGGIFIKLIPWNSFVIAGWRSLVSFGTVMFFLRLFKIKYKFGRSSVIMGIFMCLTFFAFVTANKLTTAANAIVLQFTAPLFIMAFSAVLFHEKFRRADIAAVLISLCGIALFFFDRLKGGYLLGNIVAILSGVFMAIMYISIGKADEESRMGGMLLGHLFTAAVGIPVTFFVSTPVSAGAILCILALGVIQLGIPYILLTLSSKNCPPLACSLLGAIEPLLNPVWVFLFNGEAPGAFSLAGGFVVIVTITLWCIWQNKHPSSKSEADSQIQAE